MKPMKIVISVLGLALLFASGCQEDDADIGSGSFSLQTEESSCENLDALADYNNGPLPSHCSKIEGGQIGRDGIVINVDGTEITITKWTSKDGEKGEYIGFEYSVDGEPIALSVKAGKQTFQAGETGSWKNPNGTFGPGAKGISNVVFCLDLTCGDNGSDNGEGEGASGSDSSDQNGQTGNESGNGGSGDGASEGGDGSASSGDSGSGSDPSDGSGSGSGSDPSDGSGSGSGSDPSDGSGSGSDPSDESGDPSIVI